MIDGSGIAHLRELLGRENNISILVKKNPTLDSMAGALSLYLSLLKAGKTVSIVCPTEPIVEYASLVGIDKVSKQPDSSGRDLTIALPYEKGRVEKISYNIEDDRIHLVVKAGPDGLGFDTRDVTFSKTGGSPAGMIFFVAIQDPTDLGNLYSEGIPKEAIVVHIGTTESQSLMGRVEKLQLVEEGASSISEIIANILNNLAAPIDVDIAQNLMNGIIFATSNFQSTKVTPLAFEMAAFLLRYGAKREGEEKVKKSTSTDVEVVELKEQKQQKQAPVDWLKPKIYTGSTLP